MLFLWSVITNYRLPTLTVTVSQVTLTGESTRQTPQANLHSLALEGTLSLPFWLIVPTYNPGLQAWADWLQALKAQQSQPSRVIVVDSGSTDGSLALTQQAVQSHSCHTEPALEATPFTLLHVNAAQFDHGGTRQWALDQALLEPAQMPPQVVLFMTQDAVLAHPDALSNLIQTFQSTDVAAAFGRQLPKPQASWLEAHARQYNYPGQSRRVQLQDKDKLGLKVCFFSNAFGAYRLSALQAMGGLPTKLPLGEDTYLAAKLLLSGQSIQYQAEAAVYHSHHYNGQQDFQRMFDTGVLHAQNPWILQSFGSAEGQGWQLAQHQWEHLKLLVRPQETPLAVQSKVPSLLGGLFQMLFTNSLKLLGFKLGQSHRLLPKALKRHLSMHKSFWKQQA